jgi:hypothetical protein
MGRPLEQLAAAAMVRAGVADQLPVVVAQRWVAGAAAREVGVGPLAGAATLAVVEVVAVAEQGPPLVYREQQHDRICTAPGTKGLQTAQNFFFAACSTLICSTTFSCFS